MTKAQLDTVVAQPASGATLPLAAALTDPQGRTQPLGVWLAGRPALLLLADYRCTQVCGPMLSVAARALQAGALSPTTDFNLLVLDFNPAASGRDGDSLRQAELGAFPELARAAVFLTAAPDTVAAVERSLGVTTLYDGAAGRFAHPADVFVLTPEGRVSHVLDGLVLDPDALRLALVEAGHGTIGSLVDRVHVLCYGLDPATGLYTGAILTVLKIGATLTLVGLGTLVLLGRRRPPVSGEGPA